MPEKTLLLASTTVIIAILILAFTSYAFVSTATSLSELSKQNQNLETENIVLAQQLSLQNQQISSLNQQESSIGQGESGVASRTLQAETTTVIETSTSVSTSVAYSTLTTTSEVYPPSNSTYALTYVDGNSTESYPSCGAWTIALDVTYEVHQQLPPSVMQWAEFPSGVLMQPSTQQVFPNHAYVTIVSTYSGNTGACGGGTISSLIAFVTDSNNNQLSPSVSFVVQQQ
ncbi:MAG TPA: hypothetical protein VEJ36_00585 [Nitrososphaerales archaeon]|nr:hypothetical protein [Nitrososphaerales archaeon]